MIYILLMYTLLVFIATPRYLISVAKSINSKRELQNEQKLVKGEVMMCVGSDSKVDKITIAHSLYPFGVSVEPKINVIWCLR